MVHIVEGGNTWRLCSIEDKPMERQEERQEEAEDEGKKGSVVSKDGNNVKPGEKQLEDSGSEGGNKTESKANLSSSGEEREVVIEEKVESLVASKEVPTGGRATTFVKPGKESREVELMVDVDQPRDVNVDQPRDVKESEKNDHTEEPILVNSNPERESEKGTTEKAETNETTPNKGSKTRPTVNTPTNISETSLQATKVKESKVNLETLRNKEMSTIFQNNEATRSSDPEAEADELFRGNESTGNSDSIVSSSQVSREPYPTVASMGSSESVSTEGKTEGRSNVLETTRSLFNRATNLILGRVSNLRRLTTSNTPGSRLKPDLESSTSSYPITASSEDEEKQLYPVANGAKSTQSSVSTDLPKLPSAAGQKEGIALSGSEGKWKGGEERLNKARMPGQANVDKSENVSSPNEDFATPQLNFTERLSVDGQSKGSNEIEMTEVLLEEPLDSIELKQVMKAVLQEAEERESGRQKRGAGPRPARRFGRARRGRKRKGAAAARHYVAGKSGRDEPEYIVSACPCLDSSSACFFSICLIDLCTLVLMQIYVEPACLTCQMFLRVVCQSCPSLVRFPKPLDQSSPYFKKFTDNLHIRLANTDICGTLQVFVQFLQPLAGHYVVYPQI